MKRTTSPDVLLRIDRRGPLLRAQLERELRAAIRTGRLRHGMPLPSSRALAADLGVSRGLVVEAYEQLLAEGYIVARRGSATTVAARRIAPERAAVSETKVARPRFDFRPGLPDPSHFPRRAWLASLRRVLTSAPNSAFGYPDFRGTATVRTSLAEYLNRARGTAADASRIVLSTGFTQGFRLVCQALRARGARAVAFEDPSQVEQRAAIKAAGMKPIPVPVDRAGLIVEGLEKSRADAVLVTPAHQYPTGAALSPERRAALLAWAARRSAFVVEDDYDAEYRYDREPVGALQGVAPERVVYVGSASKTLAPTLRLGWLVPPADLSPAIAQAKRLEDMGSPGLEQLAFADFIAGGELDRHLRRMRAHYRAKRDVLVAALAARLPHVQVSGIAAGLHLMLELPAGSDEQAIVAAAAEHSVGVFSASRYCAKAHLSPALILGYGAIAAESIPAAVERLAAAIRG
jgi:GntR family transcriptional regulator / MocR family aminotransferase